MKLVNYIRDRFFQILVIGFAYFVILMLLLVFLVDDSLILAISLVFWLMNGIVLLMDYFRKKKYYDEFLNNLELLDKKYLILETLSKPNFYEGEILQQSLYAINKSMVEEVRNRQREIDEVKDYIEMWIHEVKIPISSLTLLFHNHKSEVNKTYLEQIRRLDNYIDQVLYYVRSNYLEEDFIIKKVRLDKVVSGVLLKNKDDLLENEIDLDVSLKEIFVYTDQKWLDFILNQIINNSIKYKRDNVDSVIRISSFSDSEKIILGIYDNGVGISVSDIPNIFKKCYTGKNGVNKVKSTGMGLYIADKLCHKLGHVLEVYSKQGEYTEIRIVFGKNDFYNEIK